jgi:hypothetical protein
MGMKSALIADSAESTGAIKSDVDSIGNAFSGLTPKMVAPFRSWLKNVGAILSKAGEYVPELAGLGAGLIAAASAKAFGQGGHATGNDLRRGIWVGDRGPEFVRFGGGGANISNASQSARMMNQPQVIQIVVDRKVLYETILNARKDVNNRDF